MHAAKVPHPNAIQGQERTQWSRARMIDGLPNAKSLVVKNFSDGDVKCDEGSMNFRTISKCDCRDSGISGHHLQSISTRSHLAHLTHLLLLLLLIVTTRASLVASMGRIHPTRGTPDVQDTNATELSACSSNNAVRRGNHVTQPLQKLIRRRVRADAHEEALEGLNDRGEGLGDDVADIRLL
jgi:hypothetical protein